MFRTWCFPCLPVRRCSSSQVDPPSCSLGLGGDGWLRLGLGGDVSGKQDAYRCDQQGGQIGPDLLPNLATLPWFVYTVYTCILLHYTNINSQLHNSAVWVWVISRVVCVYIKEIKEHWSSYHYILLRVGKPVTDTGIAVSHASITPLFSSKCWTLITH